MMIWNIKNNSKIIFFADVEIMKLCDKTGALKVITLYVFGSVLIEATRV